jgi:hypothetical protein
MDAILPNLLTVEPSLIPSPTKQYHTDIVFFKVQYDSLNSVSNSPPAQLWLSHKPAMPSPA